MCEKRTCCEILVQETKNNKQAHLKSDDAFSGTNINNLIEVCPWKSKPIPPVDPSKRFGMGR